MTRQELSNASIVGCRSSICGGVRKVRESHHLEVFISLAESLLCRCYKKRALEYVLSLILHNSAVSKTFRRALSSVMTVFDMSVRVTLLFKLTTKAKIHIVLLAGVRRVTERDGVFVLCRFIGNFRPLVSDMSLHLGARMFGDEMIESAWNSWPKHGVRIRSVEPSSPSIRLLCLRIPSCCRKLIIADKAPAEDASENGVIPSVELMITATTTCATVGDEDGCSENSSCVDGDLGIYCQCYTPKFTQNEVRVVGPWNSNLSQPLVIGSTPCPHMDFISPIQSLRFRG